MDIATQYARALDSLVREKPESGKTYISNLLQVLKRRGHEKLAPRILSQLQKLNLAHTRSEMFSTPTKESERTRVLLELYRKLLA